MSELSIVIPLLNEEQVLPLLRDPPAQNGFVPPNGLSRCLLHGMENSEMAFPFPMPFGTTILVWGQLRT
jgi:hypothetical protein